MMIREIWFVKTHGNGAIGCKQTGVTLSQSSDRNPCQSMKVLYHTLRSRRGPLQYFLDMQPFSLIPQLS